MYTWPASTTPASPLKRVALSIREPRRNFVQPSCMAIETSDIDLRCTISRLLAWGDFRGVGGQMENLGSIIVRRRNVSEDSCLRTFVDKLVVVAFSLDSGRGLDSGQLLSPYSGGDFAKPMAKFGTRLVPTTTPPSHWRS